MRPWILAISAVAIMAGATQPAAAQAVGNDLTDSKCILVLQAVGQDPKQRDQAARGIFFYLGRLSARGPLARLEPILVAEGKKLNTPQLLQAELARCGGELNQRSGELQAINKNLQKQFGAAAAPPVKK
jgi:hypothetical protein